MPIDYTQFKLLSFDVYGTLIDWEQGIYDALTERLGILELERTLAPSGAADLRRSLLFVFNDEEKYIQREFGSLTYPNVLKEVYLLVCERLELEPDLEKAVSFGSTVGSWNAFPDTVEALQRLAKYYKLGILSNVDESSLGATLRGPLYGVKFDALYTAEGIGSYKPSLENFKYLIEHARRDFKIEQHEILHVAHSFTHDHVPAKRVGLQPGVWIKRLGDKAVMAGNFDKLKRQGKVDLGAEFVTLAELADAVDAAFQKHSLI